MRIFTNPLTALRVAAMTITETQFSKIERRSNLRPEPNFENLKFERQDWTLFRTVEGLQQKAGVPAKLLRRLVLKELADNALDTGCDVRTQSVGETCSLSKTMDQD